MTSIPPETGPEEREAYYRAAASWSHDREDALRKSRRVAWIFAGVAAGVALAEAFALVALTPLKTVQPYTLLVDRQTGFVQALDPLQPSRVSADTALTQSFVVQYVIARESFDIAAAQANYKKVAAWSDGRVRSNYIAAVQSSNPQSPIATLPRTTIIETRVKSISTTARNTLLVRFDTQRRDDGGRVYPAQPWVAVVRYRYTGEPMALEDRLFDPLGFRVTHYQRSAEALVPAAAPVAAVAVPATVVPATGVVPVVPVVPVTSVPGATVRTPSPLRQVRQPTYAVPARLPAPPVYTGPPREPVGGQP
ncbi:virB8 family protein [Sphingomonas sp. Leaf33]|uniref:virB8 family protein n=1 Tax=Sphingomonas sp. Leaf33 TaxID=1736215 RepID=UPI0009EBC5E8|nr:type IV secretion system protein [Sphingomonas sp. Leaf33]